MSPSPTSNRRIAKNTVALYVRMLFIMIVTLYTSRVVLRTLGETDFGIFNVVGGVVAMMSFLNSSMTAGFQRYFNIALGEGDTARYRKVFSVAFAIQLLIISVVLLLAESVGLWFLNHVMVIPEERLFAANIVYQAAIAVIAINAFISPFTAIIISHERMTAYAAIGIVHVFAKLIIVFLLASVESDKLIAYSVLLIAVDLLVLLANVFCVRHIDGTLSARPLFDRKLLRSMMGFSVWNTFAGFGHLMKGQGLNIVLNLFFGPAVNAARGIAFQVSGAATSFYTNFQMAVRPQVMKCYAAGQMDEMIRLTYMMSRLSFSLMWIVALPLLFSTEWVMHLWLGDAVPSLAPSFARIVLLTGVVESLATPLTTVVHATGRMRTFQLVCSSIILLIVPAAYLALWLGAPPQAALWISLVIVSVVHGVRMLLLRGIVRFSARDYVRRVLLPIMVVASLSFAVSLIVASVTNNGVLRFVCSFLVAVSSSYFWIFDRRERTLLWGKIKQFLRLS